jgi:hypothetical protein
MTALLQLLLKAIPYLKAMQRKDRALVGAFLVGLAVGVAVVKGWPDAVPENAVYEILIGLAGAGGIAWSAHKAVKHGKDGKPKCQPSSKE